MRSVVVAPVLLLALSVPACQDDAPSETDAEEFALENAESGGPVLDFPDGSQLYVEIIASFPDDCEVEMRADSFSFDLIPDTETEGYEMTIRTNGFDDDLDRLVECTGLIDPDE